MFWWVRSGFWVSFWTGSDPVHQKETQKRYFGKNPPTEIEQHLRFQPLRGGSICALKIRPWKALIKAEFWTLLLGLLLPPQMNTRIWTVAPLKFWYQNRRTGSEQVRNTLSASAPSACDTAGGQIYDKIQVFMFIFCYLWSKFGLHKGFPRCHTRMYYTWGGSRHLLLKTTTSESAVVGNLK
jgi:hypothetical protein